MAAGGYPQPPHPLPPPSLLLAVLLVMLIRLPRVTAPTAGEKDDGAASSALTVHHHESGHRAHFHHHHHHYHLVAADPSLSRHRRRLRKDGSPAQRFSLPPIQPQQSSDCAAEVSSPSASESGAFTTPNCTIVIAQTSSTATLPCIVRKFNSGTISWIRRRDYQLLTVGLAPYSGDNRFFVEHLRHLQNWGLQIRGVREDDAGKYECQISTHPPSSIFIELRVLQAWSEIVGAPDIHVKAGSYLRLVCQVRFATELPEFVFWYRGDKMVNYDEEGVTVIAPVPSVQPPSHSHHDASPVHVSVLLVDKASTRDSGNYTCTPSNALPASIMVHVLQVDEKPAAMQHGSHNSSPCSIYSRTGCPLLATVSLLSFSWLWLWSALAVTSTANVTRARRR